MSFQSAVSDFLIRHRSVLDVLTKLQEASARVNRTVVKAITSCGCVGVHAGKQELPDDVSYWQLKEHMQTHLVGELCEQCKEVLESELGRNLFYVTAVCDLFNLELGDVISNEYRRITALGVYNLT